MWNAWCSRLLGPNASAADGIEADAAGAAEQQSLEWLWTQDEYDESYFGDLPRNGYTSVVEAMASGLDIRLDWPVAPRRARGSAMPMVR